MHDTLHRLTYPHGVTSSGVCRHITMSPGLGVCLQSISGRSQLCSAEAHKLHNPRVIHLVRPGSFDTCGLEWHAVINEEQRLQTFAENRPFPDNCNIWCCCARLCDNFYLLTARCVMYLNYYLTDGFLRTCARPLEFRRTLSLPAFSEANMYNHRRTAVRPVLTATSQSNGNGQTSTPHRIKTP